MPVGTGLGSFLAWPSAVAQAPSEVVEGSKIAAVALPGSGECRRSFSTASGSGPRTLAVKTVSSGTRFYADDAPCLEMLRIPLFRMMLLC